MNNIEKTIKFLQESFDKSEHLKRNPESKEYRLNHTYRVAAIGKEIALKENLNVDAVVIGCLLHDLSYVCEMKTRDDRLNHGRKAASMARDFVMTLDLEEHLKHELLYGIAIHVDDKSDFEGDRTVLAELISECDNIDRFDRYRLYEGLLYSDLDKMTLEDQIEFAEKKIKGLTKAKDYVFGTKTSNDLWQSKLDYQIEYYKGLLEQLKTSDYTKL